MPHPPRSCDNLDDDHMKAEVHRRWGGGGGSSYPWSRFMAGCPILISMASLTFLFSAHEHHKITKDSVKVLAREDVWLKRKVRKAISVYLDTCPNQFGFKRNHSTDQCIYVLKRDYRRLSCS